MARWRRQLLPLVGLVCVAGGIAAVAVRQAGTTPTDSPVAVAAAARQSLRIDRSKAVVDYGQFEARVARLMQDPNMVGLAVATVEDGRVTFSKGYGETSAGSGDPVTTDTVFRWASLSKGVAASLLAALAGEGRLSLDAPVASFATSLTIPGGTTRVTVADVLSHRLGIVRNAWDDRLEKGDDPRVIRAQLGTLPPFCPPGACHAYQNVAFDTASEIVERVTHESYARAAQTRLFTPLGMADTSIGRAGLEGAASWARPHRRGRQPTVVTDAYYRVPAAGGVNSSIRDLLRWMEAQMGDAPDVLSPAVLATLHAPRVAAPPHGRRGPMEKALANPSYGLAWRSYTYAGHRLVGHRGAVDGYGSLMLFDPALHSGIVMLWNSNFFPAGRLQLEFFDRLYGLPPSDWLALGDATDTTTDTTDEPAVAPNPAG